MHSSLVQVVGYDGSPLSELGLRRAVEEAMRADFAVVHVVAVVEAAGTMVKMPDGTVLNPWAGLSALRLTVRELLRTWGVSDQLVHVVAHVTTGEPGPTLVDLAVRLEAHSITVGLRGTRSSLSRSQGTTLGSVARYLARNATCKVLLQSLLVPREAARPSDPLRLYLVLGDGFTLPGAPLPRMARA
jgi:nucleotide-binding universal stress UspA family protein